MFTGIVSACGEVLKAEDGRLWISSPCLEAREIGSSVAIDGVCLTVVERDVDVCAFDVSAETLSRTTLGDRAAGDLVNLETPLTAGDELGGHIVQGHVDTVGHVASVAPGGRVRIGLDSSWMRYVVEKGSVALDGVSLTVTTLDDEGFEVALVPHTLEVTTLGTWGPGRKVNVEVDQMAKYVEKFVENMIRRPR